MIVIFALTFAKPLKFIQLILVYALVQYFTPILHTTTEAMGIWRFAGAFAVALRQSECGNRTGETQAFQPMKMRV